MSSKSVLKWLSVLTASVTMMLVLPLLGLGADQPEPEKSGAKNQGAEAKPGCGCGGAQAKDTRRVCCYFPFAWTESYVSWYAEMCPQGEEPNAWVCYDAPLGDPADPHPFCPDSGPNDCVGISALVRLTGAVRKDNPYQIENGLKSKGHKKKYDPEHVMTVISGQNGSGQRFDSRTLEIKLKPIGNNPVAIYAKVTDIAATPTISTEPPPPTKHFYLGNEIKETADFNATIDVLNVTVVPPANGNHSYVLIVKDTVAGVDRECRIVTNTKIKPWP